MIDEKEKTLYESHKASINDVDDDKPKVSMKRNMSSIRKSMHKNVMGHPAGLFVLFFTEMWERFSYYGMRGNLFLFLTAETTAANPGFGWSDSDAYLLYGIYTCLVYLVAVPGGIVADRWLG